MSADTEAPGVASHRLADLAAEIGARVEGDGGQRVAGLGALPDAGPDDLAPFLSPAYRDRARESRAGAFLVPEDHGGLLAGLPPRPLLVARRPAEALDLLVRRFHPEPSFPPGVHPTAVVGEGCRIDPSAHVGPYAVIGAGSEIGAGAVVGPLAVVGDGCRVGEQARLHPHAVLYGRTELGARSIVHSGAVVGSDGFGYTTTADGVHRKAPQVGRTVIGEDVEIGANTAVDRGALGATVIGDGSKLDNLVQVAHNVRTGRGVLLCGQAGIAGSTVLGDHVVLAGQAGVDDHRRLGHRVQVAAKSAVFSDVPDDTKVGGIPAVELGAWRRQSALLRRLREMARRLREVETTLERRTGDGPAAGDEEEP